LSEKSKLEHWNCEMAIRELRGMRLNVQCREAVKLASESFNAVFL